MLLLYKTYVRSKLEYACLCWRPTSINNIEKLEGVQKAFTKRIDGMDNLNYYERLQSLNLYSLQRRRERYEIIQIWKILNGLWCPNFKKK